MKRLIRESPMTDAVKKGVMSTTLKVTLDGETLKRLAEISVVERRPMDLMAEVLIMRQLGCWPQTPVIDVTADEGDHDG
jgi:hypothetical protein